jgi:tetratricopeptide (TPR) repeat protein
LAGLVRDAAQTASNAAQAPDEIETRSRQLLDARNLDQAEGLLRALTARAPERATAWFLLGRVRHAQGDLDAAIDFLRKAIRRFVAAHNDLGIFLQGRGQNAEAEACYRHAVELAPRFAEAMSNLGVVLAEHGRLNEASRWYSRAITERRDFADAHNNLGATHRPLAAHG